MYRAINLSKHASQTDAAKGFGGKYGVQKDRVDKSAVDWTYQEKLQQHQSQTGYIFTMYMYLVLIDK